MKTVGIRELKDRLSEYLRQVRSGENVLVTDRGQVVAEISPPGKSPADSSVPTGLRELARRGLATLGPQGNASLYPALPRSKRGRRTAARILDEERGGR
ncbi:MAG: hypothetical protein NVS1B6_12280 [Steroidobacteraceae bacterium]